MAALAGNVVIGSFTLSRSVDSSAIVANYRQGVLEIEIPKKDEAKPKQIQINVGAKEEIHA